MNLPAVQPGSGTEAGFDPLAGGPGWQWMKLLVGAIIVGAVFFGGEVLLHGEGLLRYARYAVDGLAATWLTPWLFARWLRRQPLASGPA